jgi:hypothetical protein
VPLRRVCIGTDASREKVEPGRFMTHHKVFRGAYTAGGSAPLLRRPIIFGCTQGTGRPNDLGVRLELQAQPGGRIGRCWNVQEGGETDGLPWLVNVSCEVGDGLCRDILCLVRWVSVRHAVGPSGARDCLGTEKRGGRPRATRGDRSYPAVGHRVVTNTIHVIWGVPGLLEMHMWRVAL